MKRFTAVLWAFAFFVGCGKSGSLKPTNLQVLATDPVGAPSLGQTSGQGATSGALACPALNAKLERLNGTGDVALGSSVRFRITATYCQNTDIFFRIPALNKDFSSSIEIDKRYDSLAAVREQVVVDAVVRSTGVVAASGISGAISFNVVDRNSPSLTISNTEVPTFYFKPFVTIRRLGPITTLNQPAAIQITVDEPYTRLSLNDSAVPADRPLYLNPLYTNTGHYFGRVVATGPGGETAVTIDFQVPVCTHTVENVTLNSIRTKTTVSAGTHVVVINGESAPVNPQQLTITKDAALNYVPGARTSTAIVRNILTGDEGSCSATYRQMHAPITVTQNSFPTHYFYQGFALGNSGSEVITGTGSNNPGTNSHQIGTTSIPVRSSTKINRGAGPCGPNEIQTGRFGNGYDHSCSPLLPELELYAAHVKVLAYDLVSAMSCDADEVLIGSKLVYWERPGGYWGNMYLHCAKIKFKGE